MYRYLEFCWRAIN